MIYISVEDDFVLHIECLVSIWRVVLATLLCNVRGWTRDGKNSCGGMAISIEKAWVATDTDGFSFVVIDWLPSDISNGWDTTS